MLLWRIKKNPKANLLDEFELLFDQCRNAFKQTRSMLRAKDLAFGVLNCMGKHTLTGVITAYGKQFIDWSSNYRLFQSDKMNLACLFGVARKELVKRELDSQSPIYGHMDDTLIKKKGRKVVGAAWRWDPLGPPFNANFIWGQRFIQLSISLPEKEGPSRARAIPVDFYHCPTVAKPKKSDKKEAWDTYKEKQKKAKLSQKGLERIVELRENLDKDGVSNRELIVGVDGSYTNETVLKKLPGRTTIIGRIRKDTKLNELPNKEDKTTGRNRIYGKEIPAPEEIRRNENIPWQEVKAYAAGKEHTFNVKVIKNIRWRKAGHKNLQLVIIRPLAYRLTKKSRLLYRDPAYLICTNPNLDIEKLLQAYLWRWDIEVNFKEEKSILGCGQAQVRTKEPVEKVPAFIVAVYAFIQLAAHKAHKVPQANKLPRAKWYSKKPTKRITTGDIINEFKAQLWAKSMNVNFTNFVNQQNVQRSGKNHINPAISAALYARN